MNLADEDKFVERLAYLDDQIASGAEIAIDTLHEEPDMANRLQGALECLQLLEQVWPRQPDTALPTMPRVFGRYHVVRELGQGGFGIVLLAEDLQLARDVAIKVQRPESLLSPDARKRFMREARASAPLKHPNLVTVYDSGEEGLWCWIASEVVQGPSLNRFLESLRAQSKLPAVQDAVMLLRELAEGVAHAHAHGVLHRDIKPANILLEPRCESPETLADYRAKLADFGLARSLESGSGETRTGARLGTPAYMAPEQVEGRQEQIGPATDVYGLGVLLHELLTGTPPFTGEFESDVLKQVLLGEPRSLRQARPEISRDLEAIVLKCLEKNPSRRYANVRALSNDLGRLLAGEPTAARPITTAHRALRWTRRHPGLCATIGTGFLAVIALVIAAQLSHENYRLAGYREVMLETEPSGARVVFVPLDLATGNPVEGGVIHAAHRSPIVQELEPGDYLVVAVSDDGRFHEVFRHVPRANVEIPELYNHHYFKELGNNRVLLPPVTLPEKSVSKGMALVEPRPTTVGGKSKSGGRPFFMDCTEVTYRQANATLKWMGMNSARGNVAQDTYAAVTPYDHALAVAEKMGKRLPFAYEYDAAVNRCLRADNWSAAVIPLHGFAPVGVPAGDITDTEIKIVGLRSNVAEWTCTRSQPYPGRFVANSTYLESRIARGGNLEVVNGTNVDALEIREKDASLRLLRYRTWPGVGFRCVRSERPSFIDTPTGVTSNKTHHHPTAAVTPQ